MNNFWQQIKKPIIRFLHKFPTAPDDSLLTQNNYGNWFVRYFDGLESQYFFHDVACHYANKFGGTVHHSSERMTKRLEDSVDN